jgi:hypothetical protein
MFARAPWASGMESSTFDDRLEEDFQWPGESSPWPEIGDRLFGQPTQSAWLRRHKNERYYLMTQGYKLAADLLVEQAEAGGWKRRGQLECPIVFCYRHFLELTLKGLLEKYGSMTNIEPDRENHQLEILWRNFRKLLDTLNLDGQQEKHTTDVVEKCIAELAKVDPKSQTFRYPTSKNGQPFELVPDSVDLSRLHGTMQKIDTYFGCVGSELYRIENYQSEMLAACY